MSRAAVFLAAVSVLALGLSSAAAAPQNPDSLRVVYSVETLGQTLEIVEQFTPTMHSERTDVTHMLWRDDFQTLFADDLYELCIRVFQPKNFGSILHFWGSPELVGTKDCHDLSGATKTCEVWSAFREEADGSMHSQTWTLTVEEPSVPAVLLDTVSVTSSHDTWYETVMVISEWSLEVDPAEWEMIPACLEGPPPAVQVYTSLEDIWSPCLDDESHLCKYWHGYLHRDPALGLFVRDSTYLDKYDGEWKTEWSRYDAEAELGLSYVEPLECSEFGWSHGLPSFDELWNNELRFDGWGAHTRCGMDYCTVWKTEDETWKVFYDELYSYPVRREQFGDDGQVVAAWDYDLLHTPPSESDFDIIDECLL